MDLAPYLEKLEAAVDPEHVAQAQARQEAAISYQEVDRIPLIMGFPGLDWRGFPYSEAFHDMEKMLVNELAGPYAGAVSRDDRIYAIRANYGVGGIATLFGCKTRLVDNQMPYAEPLSDEELDGALESGPPEIRQGLGARVLETEEFYLKTLADYPRLAKAVHVYVSDTQGPFDAAHLIMGHRIYTEIYDNPERVHRLLEIVCDTYIRYTQAQKSLIGETEGWHYHGAFRLRGGVRVCEDTPTNLSPATYQEFCRPYNERVLAAFGGGWIHYCGRGHQILESVLSTPGLTGINFGNPEVQDFSRVASLAGPQKIALIGPPKAHLDELKPSTGTVVTHHAGSLEEARAITA